MYYYSPPDHARNRSLKIIGCIICACCVSADIRWRWIGGLVDWSIGELVKRKVFKGLFLYHRSRKIGISNISCTIRFANTRNDGIQIISCQKQSFHLGFKLFCARDSGKPVISCTASQVETINSVFLVHSPTPRRRWITSLLHWKGGDYMLV